MATEAVTKSAVSAAVAAAVPVTAPAAKPAAKTAWYTAAGDTIVKFFTAPVSVAHLYFLVAIGAGVAVAARLI